MHRSAHATLSAYQKIRSTRLQQCLMLLRCEIICSTTPGQGTQKRRESGRREAARDSTTKCSKTSSDQDAKKSRFLQIACSKERKTKQKLKKDPPHRRNHGRQNGGKPAVSRRWGWAGGPYSSWFDEGPTSDFGGRAGSSRCLQQSTQEEPRIALLYQAKSQNGANK